MYHYQVHLKVTCFFCANLTPLNDLASELVTVTWSPGKPSLQERTPVFKLPCYCLTQFIFNININLNMRCLTKASTAKKTKTASPVPRFRFCPEFSVCGIAHTKSHCSHNKALGCHTHVDQINRHFSISPALQSI